MKIFIKIILLLSLLIPSNVHAIKNIQKQMEQLKTSLINLKGRLEILNQKLEALRYKLQNKYIDFALSLESPDELKEQSNAINIEDQLLWRIILDSNQIAAQSKKDKSAEFNDFIEKLNVVLGNIKEYGKNISYGKSHNNLGFVQIGFSIYGTNAVLLLIEYHCTSLEMRSITLFWTDCVKWEIPHIIKKFDSVCSNNHLLEKVFKYINPGLLQEDEDRRNYFLEMHININSEIKINQTKNEIALPNIEESEEVHDANFVFEDEIEFIKFNTHGLKTYGAFPCIVFCMVFPKKQVAFLCHVNAGHRLFNNFEKISKKLKDLGIDPEKDLARAYIIGGREKSSEVRIYLTQQFVINNFKNAKISYDVLKNQVANIFMNSQGEFFKINIKLDKKSYNSLVKEEETKRDSNPKNVNCLSLKP